VHANDAHLDMALMWQAVVRGWRPPDSVTEAEYRALRDAEPSALRGFVGSGGSFGGKWFGGYARGGFNGATPRNHQGESARAVARIGDRLQAAHVVVTHSDYRALDIPPGAVVYCDPPYRGTQGYAAGAFDHVDFWAWAEVTSDFASVYVSEYRAPSWWHCIWSTEKRQSVTRPDQGRELRTERLFALRP
jgi:DNA adenine methylase